MNRRRPGDEIDHIPDAYVDGVAEWVRVSYRKQPSEQVMAQHLETLRQTTSSPGRRRLAPSARASFVAACILIVAGAALLTARTDGDSGVTTDTVAARPSWLLQASTTETPVQQDGVVDDEGDADGESTSVIKANAVQLDTSIAASTIAGAEVDGEPTSAAVAGPTATPPTTVATTPEQPSAQESGTTRSNPVLLPPPTTQPTVPTVKSPPPTTQPTVPRATPAPTMKPPPTVTLSPSTTGPPSTGPAGGGKGGPPSLPSGQRCDGRLATIVGGNQGQVIVGTEGQDVIVGGNGADRIFGLGGDDIICGGNGADTVFGGPGDDRLFGGNGKDRLLGNSGDDRLVGGNGRDDLDGGEGQNRLTQ